MTKHTYFQYKDLKNTEHFRKIETIYLNKGRKKECYEVVEAPDFSTRRIKPIKKYDINDDDECVKVSIKAVLYYDELLEQNTPNVNSFFRDHSDQVLKKVLDEYLSMERNTDEIDIEYAVKNIDRKLLMSWLDEIAIRHGLYKINNEVPKSLWLICTNYQEYLFTFAIDYSTPKHELYDIFITKNYEELVYELRMRLRHTKEWAGTFCINFSKILYESLSFYFPDATIFYDIQQLVVALDRIETCTKKRYCQNRLESIKDPIRLAFNSFYKEHNVTYVISCYENCLSSLEKLLQDRHFETQEELTKEILELLNLINDAKNQNNNSSFFAMLDEMNIWCKGYIAPYLLHHVTNIALKKPKGKTHKKKGISAERLRIMLLAQYHIQSNLSVNFQVSLGVKSKLPSTYKCASGNIPNERSIYLKRYKCDLVCVLKVVRAPRVINKPTNVSRLIQQLEYIQSNW